MARDGGYGMRTYEDQRQHDIELLQEVARDVCMYCGGRAYPDSPESHVAHGPNELGNYWHDVPHQRYDRLCDATQIHARIDRLRQAATALVRVTCSKCGTQDALYPDLDRGWQRGPWVCPECQEGGAT
jgi:hypothetical protein